MKRNTKIALTACLLGVILMAWFASELIAKAHGELNIADFGNATLDTSISIPSTSEPSNDTTPADDINNNDVADDNDYNSSVSSNSTSTTSVRKPTLADMYKEEDFLGNYVDEVKKAEDFTSDEVIEVLEQLEEMPEEVLEDPAALAQLPAITVEQVLEAVTEVIKDRTETAVENVASGIRSETPDVGTSNVETLETIPDPETEEVRDNDTTSVAKVDETTVAIKVEEPVAQTTIATKTLVRVFCPDGDTHEYLYEGESWAAVDMTCGYGQYVINVYQDVDGKGYKLVSQTRETKEAPVVSTPSTPASKTETQPSTAGTWVTPDWSSLSTAKVETPVTEEKTVVVEEPTIESIPFVEETVVETPASTPVVEEPTVDVGGDLDDLLADLGL